MVSGAQPGQGCVVELGHLDKPFVKNARKKDPTGNNLELFLLATLKTTFWTGDLTQGWAQLGLFFPQNQCTFFAF